MTAMRSILSCLVALALAVPLPAGVALAQTDDSLDQRIIERTMTATWIALAQDCRTRNAAWGDEAQEVLASAVLRPEVADGLAGDGLVRGRSLADAHIRERMTLGHRMFVSDGSKKWCPELAKHADFRAIDKLVNDARAARAKVAKPAKP